MLHNVYYQSLIKYLCDPKSHPWVSWQYFLTQFFMNNKCILFTVKYSSCLPYYNLFVYWQLFFATMSYLCSQTNWDLETVHLASQLWLWSLEQACQYVHFQLPFSAGVKRRKLCFKNNTKRNTFVEKKKNGIKINPYANIFWSMINCLLSIEQIQYDS